jgi:parallel beta-helix repeat protein
MTRRQIVPIAATINPLWSEQKWSDRLCRLLQVKPLTRLAVAVTYPGLSSFGMILAQPIGWAQPAIAPSVAPQIAQVQIAQVGAIVYVNPNGGQDAPNAGSTNLPYRTIAYALQTAKPSTTVRLAAGTYSAQTGETFPLVLPQGVILAGDESNRGQTVVITGGGRRVSPTFAGQNMTVWAGRDTQIRGVTVTNTNVRGTGIWVESVNPTIENCTFTQNNREGVFVTGTGNPTILNSTFVANGGNGLSVANNAKGQVENNLFQNTGFGVAISENASPTLVRNQIVQNVDGLYLNDGVKPILRSNLITNNQRDGLVATGSARPDLGTLASPGNNIFRDNGQYDINNGSAFAIAAYGNTLDVKKISGSVSLGGTPDTPPLGTLTDIAGHWAQAQIEALVKRGVISGFPGNVFRPNDPVTRVQYASIISRAFNPSPKRPAIAFTDINSSYWGFPFIQTAVRGVFMSGYPEGNFIPDQQIPRVQVFVALSSGLGYGNGDPAVLSRYQDAGAIPFWAKGWVAAATQRRVVVNYPNLALFNPNQVATRGEVAAIVYQALVNAGQADPIPSPYVVQ